LDQKTFSVSLKRLENYLFEVDFGEFGNIMVDEPAPLGGGEGPDPSAMLAASVANCMAASLLFALQKYKNDPGELKASIEGTVQRVDNYKRITALRISLQLGVPHKDLPSLDKALAQFENFCVVTQSVQRGIPVSVEVIDSDGEKVSV
jgi:uncharacterized OsmC-like protein